MFLAFLFRLHFLGLGLNYKTSRVSVFLLLQAALFASLSSTSSPNRTFLNSPTLLYSTMRLSSLISSLAILATAVAGVSLPRQDDNCGSEIGCELAQSVKRDLSHELPARTVPGLTNAELARRGLPFKDPIVRRGEFTWLWRTTHPANMLSIATSR